MRLLLHTCCAPCAIGPLKEATKDGYDVSAFFYNPNIQPPSEYKKRFKEARKFFGSAGLTFTEGAYGTADFFCGIPDFENKTLRCPACWRMRLEKTADLALREGFDAFTTTLLVSPYQDHGTLKIIGSELAAEKKIKFYYRDFRAGFKEAHREARERGIYCQNYCGCVFSLVEREESGLKKKLHRHSRVSGNSGENNPGSPFTRG